MICLLVEDGSAGEAAGAGEEVTLTSSAATSPGCHDGGGPRPMLVSMEPARLTWDMPIPTPDTTGTGNSMVTRGRYLD